MTILSKHRNNSTFCNAKNCNILIDLQEFNTELEKHYYGGGASVVGLYCMCANDFMPPLRNITKKVRSDPTRNTTSNHNTSTFRTKFGRSNLYVVSRNRKRRKIMHW